MERIRVEGKNAYTTQSPRHRAITHISANECENADFVSSTGHGAYLRYLEANGCNIADYARSTGHGAFSPNIGANPLYEADCVQRTGHGAFSPTSANEGKNEDFAGRSADIGSIDTWGKDPMADLVTRMARCQISGEVTKFQAAIPSSSSSSSPIKQSMYEGLQSAPERYIENLHLLGKAWVQKVRHVARLTLNSSTGPKWPTEVEPTALKLFDFLSTTGVDLPSIPNRADFLDEIDLVWRENPPWLPPGQTTFIPIWEYVTGMARTWGWKRHPRSRFYQNKSSKAARHHVLKEQNVPTVAQYIRTNRFYHVGDDRTACERPESSLCCRHKCLHTERALTTRRLKKKHGLIRAPGVEPENEHGGIE